MSNIQTKKKRYQECNPLEKLWRRRYYLGIPKDAFQMWVRSRVWAEKSSSDLHSFRNCWSIAIGSAQVPMEWYYTQEEVFSRIGKSRAAKPSLERKIEKALGGFLACALEKNTGRENS